MSQFRIVGLLLLLISSFAMGSDLQVTAFGQWASDYSAPSGSRYGWYWNANIWLDLEATPDLEAVGIHWTTDAWQTVHDSAARLDESPENSAVWSIDVRPAAEMSDCYWCDPKELDFEYALYAVIQGETKWFNNYGENFVIPIDSEYHE